MPLVNFTTIKMSSLVTENVEYTAAAALALAFLSRLSPKFEFGANDATPFKSQNAPLRLVHSRRYRYRHGIPMVTPTNAII